MTDIRSGAHPPGSGRRALSAATLAVSLGRPPAEPDAALNPPVVLSSTYVARPAAVEPGDRVYARFDNPTWAAFETVLAGLEDPGQDGTRALLFGSGMAAVSAVLDQVPHGAPVVVPRHPYSGLSSLLALRAGQGRLVPRPVALDDTAEVASALEGAALLWVETPTNPMLEVADLAALVGLARAGGVLVAADNTFASPVVMRPLQLGVDIVVHSVTKYLAGHSDVLLGATVARRPDLSAALHTTRTLTGGIPGPMEAWLALRGVRTLALRVQRSSANAAELAARLAGHPAVTRVRYPGLATDPGHARAAAQMDGFGSIVSIELADARSAEQVCAAVRLWTHATSLGGVESTLERRRRHPAESPDVPEGLVRLSVGVEDVEDLWDDLTAALDELP